MLAASLLGETSIATASSVTKESLTHNFAEMSLVSLYFWSKNPNFVSFLHILWPCLGKVCVAFEGFPQDSQSLFNEVASSGVLRQQFISSEEVSPESNVDETLMAALSDC